MKQMLCPLHMLFNASKREQINKVRLVMKKIDKPAQLPFDAFRNFIRNRRVKWLHEYHVATEISGLQRHTLNGLLLQQSNCQALFTK
jgi:hypothetical protein